MHLSRGVAYVNQLPLERELELRQLTDPKILNLSQELELKEDPKFLLIDGLVYRRHGNQKRFVVPDSMMTSVLRAHHDEMAHCDAEKTIQGIQQNFWFPSLRKRVCDYIENCLMCVMSSSATNRLESETQLFPLPKVPLEVLHLDHFGPLQESGDNFKHILVIVDAFTRFTWLYPTRSTGSKETINYLTSLFDTFGNPLKLVSDM